MNYDPTALRICLACDAIWALTIFIGTAYLVGWQGWSGWWFVFALLLAGAWSCKKYRSPEQIAADPDE